MRQHQMSCWLVLVCRSVCAVCGRLLQPVYWALQLPRVHVVPVGFVWFHAWHCIWPCAFVWYQT